MSLTFDFDDAGLHLLAVYVAQLVKEGVTFKINQGPVDIVVELLGGF